MKLAAQTPAVKRDIALSLRSKALRNQSMVVPACDPATQITCGKFCCTLGDVCFNGRCQGGG